MSKVNDQVDGTALSTGLEAPSSTDSTPNVSPSALDSEKGSFPSKLSADSIFPEPRSESVRDKHQLISQCRGAHGVASTKEEEEETLPAKKPVKIVQLYHGNLILDIPSSPHILQHTPHVPPPERDEFTHIRFSAITCAAEDFDKSRYCLRASIFAKRRSTEILVALVLGNEPVHQVALALQSVLRNIHNLCRIRNSKSLGPDAWKKVVLCVIVGNRHFSRELKALFTIMGIFRDYMGPKSVQDKAVRARLFECTMQVDLQVEDKSIRSTAPGLSPCQALICVTEEDATPINAHRWVFNAFARKLQPRICVLMNEFSRTSDDSFLKIWKAFARSPTCGVVSTSFRRPQGRTWWLHPLVAAQHVDERIRSTLDRPTDSLIGFSLNPVSPISAFRYSAVANDSRGDGPLNDYFGRETKPHSRSSIIFKIEQDVLSTLSFAVVLRKGCSWRMNYVELGTQYSAPASLLELCMMQTARLNGDMLSLLHAFRFLPRVFEVNRSIIWKACILFQLLGSLATLLIQWFSIGNLFLGFRILSNALSESVVWGQTGYILAQVSAFLYLWMVFISLVVSLNGTRTPKIYSKRLLHFAFGISAFIFVYAALALVVLMVHSIKNFPADQVRASLFSNQLFLGVLFPLLIIYGIWLLAAILFLDPSHMIFIFQYLCLFAAQINTVRLYAFCHLGASFSLEEDLDPLLRPAEQPAKQKRSPDGTGDFSSSDQTTNKDVEKAKQVLKESEDHDNIGNSENLSQKQVSKFELSVFLAWAFSNSVLVTVILNIPSTSSVDVKKLYLRTQGSILYLSIISWSTVPIYILKLLGMVIYIGKRIYLGRY